MQAQLSGATAAALASRAAGAAATSVARGLGGPALRGAASSAAAVPPATGHPALQAQGSRAPPKSWEELAALATWAADYVNGPESHAQSRLRLFGRPEADVKVTLYRDHHAWCPYCQKVWLFLEERQIPYRVDKVTMRCYGPKEAWYTKKVPSGMLPAVEIDGVGLVTESDDIIGVLEDVFGPLASGSIRDIYSLRQLERELFGAWCGWLCRPAPSRAADAAAAQRFGAVLAAVAAALESTPGDYFLAEFSIADVIFAPYLERMVASLYFYKGFDVKAAQPAVARWFAAMERRASYRGTQSDFTTHVDDLPPQMGGCYANGSAEQVACAARVRAHDFAALPESGVPEPPTSVAEALTRVHRHREAIVAVNVCKDKGALDAALRCALTTLATGAAVAPPPGTDAGLRYICSRISVPRDMSLWAARRLRGALEATAALAGPAPAPTVDLRMRLDQQPAPFGAWGQYRLAAAAH